MKEISTVTGLVKIEDLGQTLIHEHLGDAGDWCVRMGIPGWIDIKSMTQWRIDTAKNAMDVGIRTVVDCSVMNLGRYIPMMQEICKATGLQIIPATGFYYPDMLWEYSATDESFFRILMRDIEKGMDGTDVKAGIIKCATGGDNISKINERILKASARAHKESGIPIITHTEYSNRGGKIQQDIFESVGVDLNRVMIGHVGDTNDIEYIENILKRGSFIGLDRFSQDEFNTLENRCRTLATLVSKGWVGKIMISHDYPLYKGQTFWDEQDMSNWDETSHQLQYIHKKVFPLLKSLGVTDEDINTIMVENPKHFFSM